MWLCYGINVCDTLTQSFDRNTDRYIHVIDSLGHYFPSTKSPFCLHWFTYLATTSLVRPLDPRNVRDTRLEPVVSKTICPSAKALKSCSKKSDKEPTRPAPFTSSNHSSNGRTALSPIPSSLDISVMIWFADCLTGFSRCKTGLPRSPWWNSISTRERAARSTGIQDNVCGMVSLAEIKRDFLRKEYLDLPQANQGKHRLCGSPSLEQGYAHQSSTPPTNFPAH